jgi:hypothetical protein
MIPVKTSVMRHHGKTFSSKKYLTSLRQTRSGLDQQAQLERDWLVVYYFNTCFVNL